MAKHKRCETALKLARDCPDLEDAVIIGLDSKGGMQIFAENLDRDRLIVMLERAKIQLINRIGKDAVRMKDKSTTE